MTKSDETTDMAIANSASAEAGRRGDDVRSDCWVGITSTDSGGIDLELQSKVESMYGEATRRLVRAELEALGVAHARVRIEDRGALPYVIMARVETVNPNRKLHGQYLNSTT